MTGDTFIADGSGSSAATSSEPKMSTAVSATSRTAFAPNNKEQTATATATATGLPPNEMMTMTKGEDGTSEEQERLGSLSEYESESARLLAQLSALRQQRRLLHETRTIPLQNLKSEWQHRHASLQSERDAASSSCHSLRTQNRRLRKECDAMCSWHVLGDAFFIWHRGPFGIIGDSRLGRSALTTAALLAKATEPESLSTVKAGSHSLSPSDGGMQQFPFFSPFEMNIGSSKNGPSKNGAHVSSLNNHVGSSGIISSTNGNNSGNKTLEKVIVPWHEINAALGQVVFLLYTLQRIPQSGIHFRKHVLQPCGSSSKIGFLKKYPSASRTHERRRITALSSLTSPASSPPAFATIPPHEVTYYNLFHYDENGSMLSMGYFSRRNFNTALEGLGYCVAEACRAVEKRDVALTAPYRMEVGGLMAGVPGRKDEESSSTGSEPTVGGLSLWYDPSEGERWTVVCRYLLTNLKWLVAYAAKHVDR